MTPFERVIRSYLYIPARAMPVDLAERADVALTRLDLGDSVALSAKD